MSCPETYLSGGVQCHPLIVKVSYPAKINITCEQYSVDHSSRIRPSITSTTNCSQKYSKHKDGSDTYVFGINVPPNGDKCNKSGSANARIEIHVNSPTFGWHGSDEDAETFPTWDGSNPDVSVYLEAKRKDSSDSDTYSFEPMSNSNISSHLGQVRSGIFIITVDSGGKVSVTSKTAER